MNTRWFLECFGSWRARDASGRVVERLRTRKTEALLALLALSSRPQRRDELCLMLWPDAAPAASRNSLSAALSALRRDLGDDVVCADRNSVSLAPGLFSTDVAEFDIAMRENDWARAVELYRGSLLPGFDEEFFVLRCAEYEEKARGAFREHLCELEALREWNTLRALARRAMELFGAEATSFEALMRAHHGEGDCEAALRVYEEWQKWARRENEIVPDAVRQWARQLRREKENQPLTSAAPAQSTSVETSTPRETLPPPWTRFFGREIEIELVSQWLRDGERLVTLTGAGGSGKTRLAIETLRGLLPAWENRIYFVPMASLWDAELVLSAIRDALGIVASPDVSPLEQIGRALRGQKCILLLDNMEQLGTHGAAQLQELRGCLPQATFVVTSRVLLHLPGEREFAVSPLPTPLETARAEEIADYPSAALFCDRAGLTLNNGNIAPIGALCRRLDGIPLAIELAAARAKVLSPAQILERLEKHPDFLQSREFGLPERHRTLRATIEWSTDLLEPHLRDFYARLSVFRGGWTLEAAEQICAPGVCEEWDVLDFLEQLRASSLIATVDGPSGTRYRLLEMLREWGEAQLDADCRHELQMRHLEFYTQLVEGALDPFTLAQRGEELAAENGNFRAALTFALERDDEQAANDAARLTGAMGGFWEARAQHAEGSEWVKRVLSKDGDIEPHICARLMCCGGIMEWCCGDYKCALELLEDSLEKYRALGDEAGEIAALDYSAKVVGVLGRFGDERLQGQKIMAYAREHNDLARLLSSLVTTAWGALNSGHAEEAIDHLDECTTLAQSLGVHRVAALCQATLPMALFMCGRMEDAQRVSKASLEMLKYPLDPYVHTFVRGSAGIVALAMGELEFAREALPETAYNFYRISTRWEVASMLSECGNLAVVLGDYERAALIYGATEALRQQCGHEMLTCLRFTYEAGLDALKAAMSAEEIERLWARGAQMSLEEVVALTQELR
jgi:predicted ATPase/DNA-binding SARP family transcriptional activator